MIELQDVSYFYPNAAQPALDHVNLQVATGEFVLLAGHSGSGKSTLLRAINGLVPHFSGGKVSGSVWVSGTAVIPTGPQALSQLVGFVNQNPENQSLLERVEEEIAFPLEQAALPRAEMQQRVTAVMDLLDLQPLRARTLSTLSGGERQRVAIATALALQPQVLLLDEPTSQLDPDAAQDVLQALARLNDVLGLTILIAEHRLERVIQHTPRTILMADGRITADGPTRHLAARLPHQPPLLEVGSALGWEPLPLAHDEAMPFAVALTPRPAAPPAASSQKGPVVLDVRGLSVAYGKNQVLQGVDLTLHQGEIVMLMGRNGSGKSTLLRTIMGLLRPAAGEIRLQGASTLGTKTAVLARQMAMLPQNPDDLLFADTVADELAITLRNHGQSEVQQVPLLLAQLGISELGGAYPRDLSSGQRQRVALGAVTVTQPSVMLLDEPTRGLDGLFKEKMLAIWREWVREGMSMLVVTHDVELAAQVADRVLILATGRVIAEGPPAAVLSGSSPFASDMARLFPGRGWLTAEDVLNSQKTGALAE